MSSNKIFLVLDDVEINRTIVKHFLRVHYKYALILEASSGTECLKIYDELLSSFYVIDCLFLDYTLPDFDGVEVLKKLRAAGYVGPSIMISASSNEDIARMLASGMFCQVLQKPLDHSGFQNVVQSVLNCHSGNRDSCKRLPYKHPIAAAPTGAQ